MPERKRLRPTGFSCASFCPEDAEQMYTNWASDPEVTRFLRWEPHKNALETVGLLAAWATLYPNPDYYQWAIVEKASGQVFGSISIFNALLGDPAQKALWPQQDCTDGIWEAGYCIGKHWWNHGFATEALKAAVNRTGLRHTDGGWLTCCHAKAEPCQRPGDGKKQAFSTTTMPLIINLTAHRWNAEAIC